MVGAADKVKEGGNDAPNSDKRAFLRILDITLWSLRTLLHVAVPFVVINSGIKTSTWQESYVLT